MKKTKLIPVLLAAVLAAAAVTGCGDSAAKTVDVSNESKEAQPGPQNDRGIIAKVVSLDGDQLTVILAEMQGGKGENGGAPPSPASGPAIDGSGKPADGPGQPANESDQPADGSGQPAEGSDQPANGPGQPSQPEQGNLPEQGGREIEFTGDEITYTLSGEVTVSKGMGDDSAEMDLADLAAEAVIRFTTSTGEDGIEVINTIVVME